MTNDPLIGEQLANYKIERLIGRGGMAVVYYGLDVKLERPVAIKLIDARYRDNPDYADRFIREAKAVATWRHDNIVQIYYADDQNGLYFFAMEYIDGTDLGQMLADYARQGNIMLDDEVIRIGWVIANALDYAHERGVIHRDIKPSNVMVAKDKRVILTDFGLALDVQQGSMGEVFGSSHYVAPEQAMRSANAVPQSDLYSLGIVLYEMLTGVVPFDDPSPTAVAMQHINNPPPPPREINPEINIETEAVILKVLSKQPADRYQTGKDLMTALERAMRAAQPTLRDSQQPLPAGVALDDNDLIGRQLDEYRLDKLLGKGGMAAVYQGFDVGLERQVAIKVIATPFRAESDYIKRFQREAKAVAQLEHPHVVSVYRFGEAANLLYIAMQYIHGQDLRKILATYAHNNVFMPPAEISRIVHEMCDALDYAHRKGVIHRDIKPSNIMLDQMGRVTLTDFGLALLTEIGTRGEILGSPHYLAPEQAISSAGAVPQSDLYAVGVIVYQMFTGQVPFDANEPLEIAMLQMHEAPPSPRSIRPELSEEIEAVILKSLAKDPQDRYSSGTALAAALDDALKASDQHQLGQGVTPVIIPTGEEGEQNRVIPSSAPPMVWGDNESDLPLMPAEVTPPLGGASSEQDISIVTRVTEGDSLAEKETSGLHAEKTEPKTSQGGGMVIPPPVAMPDETTPKSATKLPETPKSEHDASLTDEPTLPPMPVTAPEDTLKTVPESPSLVSTLTEDTPTETHKEAKKERDNSNLMVIGGAVLALAVLACLIFGAYRIFQGAGEDNLVAEGTTTITTETSVAGLSTTTSPTSTQVGGEDNQTGTQNTSEATTPLPTETDQAQGQATATPDVTQPDTPVPPTSDTNSNPEQTNPTATPVVEVPPTPTTLPPTPTPEPPTPSPTPTPTVTDAGGANNTNDPTPTPTLSPYDLIYTTFYNGQRTIWRTNLSGRDDTALFQYGASPSSSEDGKKLYFFGEEGIDSYLNVQGTNGIWEMNLDKGEGFKQLLADGSVRIVAVSPKEDAIAFDARRGESYSTYFIDKKGKEKKEQLLAAESPSWAPDSKQVVTRSCQFTCGIAIYNKNGAFEEQLTWQGNDGLPAWSPDGKKIAFHRQAGGGLDIFVLDLEDENEDGIHPVVNLTNSPGNDTLPVWTPDSKQIIFRTTRNGRWDIFSMAADGSNQTVLFAGVGGSDEWGYDRMSVVKTASKDEKK